MDFDIRFISSKVHVHHWPPETPKWSQKRKDIIKHDLNQNKKNQIVIQDTLVSINGYEFKDIKKVGITVPLFKKQCTLIFEGQCQEFNAHVHITNTEENYLDIFNKLMAWRKKFFGTSMIS